MDISNKQKEYQELRKVAVNFNKKYYAILEYMCDYVRKNELYHWHAYDSPIPCLITFLDNNLDNPYRSDSVNARLEKLHKFVENNETVVKFTFQILRKRRQICKILQDTFGLSIIHPEYYYKSEKSLVISKEAFNNLYTLLKLEGKI